MFRLSDYFFSAKTIFIDDSIEISKTNSNNVLVENLFENQSNNFLVVNLFIKNKSNDFLVESSFREYSV